MINLQPQANFPIVRQLGNPADIGTTFYVRAVVKNARTGAILQTIDLTDQGNLRFTANYQTPADVLGLGLYIDITSTVYTDSAYTTISTKYNIENETYKVQLNWSLSMSGGGGGGGSEIDYKKIRKIIKEELAILVILLSENNKTVDLEPLQTALVALGEKIQHETIDLTPVIEALSELKSREYPQQKETDLSPVLSHLLEFEKRIGGRISDVKMPEVKAIINKVKEELAKEEIKVEEEPKVDNRLAKLMGGIQSPIKMDDLDYKVKKLFR